MNARLAALSALILATGCQSFSAPDSVVNGLAVITLNAPGTNWSSYATFDVSPIASVVDGTGAVVQNCAINATQLAQQVEKNMVARGYTKYTGGAPGYADLEIKLSAYLGDVSYYYGGYCDWYYYYYCYPGWTYAGSYSYGTLVVTMGDRKAAQGTNRMPLVWQDVNYGVLASYYSGCSTPLGTVNWSRVNEAVDRAFDQSTYILK